MKKLFLFAGVIALLCSCASLPEPENQGDSLVIGQFILDFPDGFFSEPPCKITSGITLHMVNETKDTRFTLTTSYPGYFYFLSNGSDDFKLESYEYQTQRTKTTYTLPRTPLDLKISTVPDKVIYFGNLTLSYLLPEIKREYGDRSTTWNYKHDVSIEWDKEAFLQFIKDKAPESQWLSREVVEYKAQAD